MSGSVAPGLRASLPWRRCTAQLNLTRERDPLFMVMAGLVPAIHVFARAGCKTWMPGTRPGMTELGWMVRRRVPQFEADHRSSHHMPTNRYAMLDFDLGAEIDQLRDTVRGFADDEIAPLAAEIDKTDQFPRQLWPKMGALGLHGITVEEEHGGAGMGYLAHVVAMEEVSRGSASVGLSYGAHSNLSVNQIRRNGSETQEPTYLPNLIPPCHCARPAITDPIAS